MHHAFLLRASIIHSLQIALSERLHKEHEQNAVTKQTTSRRVSGRQMNFDISRTIGARRGSLADCNAWQFTFRAVRRSSFLSITKMIYIRVRVLAHQREHRKSFIHRRMQGLEAMFFKSLEFSRVLHAFTLVQTHETNRLRTNSHRSSNTITEQCRKHACVCASNVNKTRY